MIAAGKTSKITTTAKTKNKKRRGEQRKRKQQQQMSTATFCLMYLSTKSLVCLESNEHFFSSETVKQVGTF
jgi:hypothetical protein